MGGQSNRKDEPNGPWRAVASCRGMASSGIGTKREMSAKQAVEVASPSEVSSRLEEARSLLRGGAGGRSCQRRGARTFARRARTRRRLRSRRSTGRSRSCRSRSSTLRPPKRMSRRRRGSTRPSARSRPTRCSCSSRTSARSPLLTAAAGGRAREADRARRPCALSRRWSRQTSTSSSRSPSVTATRACPSST